MWIKRIRRQGDSRFPCVTPVVETFSSDRITFRIPSNINYGAPVWKLPTGLARWLFPQKCSTTDLRQDSKCRSVKRCCKFGVRVDCKCMEFVAAGWCTRKWLRFHQTIRNLTSGDLGVLLLVIRLGLTGLKDQGCVSPRPPWGSRGEGAVWFSACGAPLDDWANAGLCWSLIHRWWVWF